MITKKYWATVEVLSGFVSAITLVVWSFRLWNSHARHRMNIVSPEGGEVKFVGFMLDAVMIGIHSFVATFFLFICSLCFYW